VDNRPLRLNVSIGLVGLNAGDQSLDSLIRRADLAMYQAKERGRNQVVTVA
jgi:diguanylate cyclase (GGDEF)-like protein